MMRLPLREVFGMALDRFHRIGRKALRASPKKSPNSANAAF
jgi:hypothetical protein